MALAINQHDITYRDERVRDNKTVYKFVEILILQIGPYTRHGLGIFNKYNCRDRLMRRYGFEHIGIQRHKERSLKYVVFSGKVAKEMAVKTTG